MPSSLDTIIARLADRESTRAEATVQADVRTFLLEAPLGLSEVHLEAKVGDGRRIDIEAGATVIEVKKDLRLGRVREEAIGQLGGYVQAREHSRGGRYVGVLTDGVEWSSYILQEGRLGLVNTHTVDPSDASAADDLTIWLEGALATMHSIKPTPEAIEARLGAKCNGHSIDRASLAALYAANADLPTVKVKRRLWARLLETALGTQFHDDDNLFIEHTLLVNTADIIAHALLGLHPEAIVPHSVLWGEKFVEASIYGVVEADFFDWVVEVEGGESFVRTLARRITRFDWSAVEHDVLKALYESVITAPVRKNLGEYYTPDWLAEVVIATAVPKPLEARVLDPACGSGTFLFHAVRRFLEDADSAKLGLRRSLDQLTSHVMGMDLHPVAVSLARVTYLLAIGRKRLLDRKRGPIRIPVFLGDSMHWHAKATSLFTLRMSLQAFSVPIDDQPAIEQDVLAFPSDLLADARVFDDLVHDMTELATQRKPASKAASLKGVLQRYAVQPPLQPLLVYTYEVLCRLHDEGRNHIWGYYVRNLARADWLARLENNVDVLIGNPPWLAYRFMPEDLQRDFGALSKDRGLWHGAKVATHQDLSALFVVRAIELYLRPEGRFAFVMPSAALDRQQFKGFRSGRYDGPGGQLRVVFDKPWDLRKLRPHFFPITASVVFGKRSKKGGKEQALPDAGEVWSGRLPARNAAWAEVAELVTRQGGTTRAVIATKRSDYHERFRQGATVVPRLLFMVERRDAGPLGHVGTRAPIRSVRSNYEKKPWKDIPSLEGSVETEFIYRMHLGETVLPYRLLEPKSCVLPLYSRGQWQTDEECLPRFPCLYPWWKQASEVWEKHRSKDTLSLQARLDYHGELSVQFPLPRRRVVYAASGMHLTAACVEDQRAVIEHGLYWGSVASEEEGQFLCAILNTPVVTTLVRPLMSFGKDERHIDKYVWALPIPLYDPSKKAHIKLAQLGAEAEATIAEMELDEDAHFISSRKIIREFLATSKLGLQIDKAVAKLLDTKT